LFRTALTDFARRGVPALTGFFADRGKSLAYTGTALAVAGAGVATSAAATAAPAAAADSGAATAVTQARSHTHPGIEVADQFWVPGRAGTTGPLQALDGMVDVHPATLHAGPATSATTPKADSHKAAASPAANRKAPSHKADSGHSAAHKTHARPSRVHVVKRSKRPTTWQQIQNLVARKVDPGVRPGALPSADRISPVSVSGPQSYMPMTTSRMENATTIVRQTLAKHMGLRSAVIAVATAMQESTLENICYGDRDSEGLFQQRPSAGWGSDAQITKPAYAADAFLTALHGHQEADPQWASQPLWANAQAVQNSGFPYAYAKWESQAAQVVSSITRHMF